jgi:hypothetical protein
MNNQCYAPICTIFQKTSDAPSRSNVRIRIVVFGPQTNGGKVRSFPTNRLYRLNVRNIPQSGHSICFQSYVIVTHSVQLLTKHPHPYFFVPGVVFTFTLPSTFSIFSQAISLLNFISCSGKSILAPLTSRSNHTQSPLSHPSRQTPHPSPESHGRSRQARRCHPA